MACRTISLAAEPEAQITRLGGGGTDPTIFTNGEREENGAVPAAQKAPLFRLDDRTFQILLVVFLFFLTSDLIGRRA